MKHAMLTLDYFALSKEAKTIKTSSAAKVIRIALLADCATQHLAAIMRAIAARNNIRAEVYEGNYDGVDLEILDPNSGLYTFDPQYVVILMSSDNDGEGAAQAKSTGDALEKAGWPLARCPHAQKTFAREDLDQVLKTFSRERNGELATFMAQGAKGAPCDPPGGPAPKKK